MGHTTRLTGLFSAIALFACGSGHSGGSPLSNDASSGTVNGKSTNAPSGSSATANQVQGDGSLQAVSSPATLDASGRYSLKVNFSGPSISDLVVQLTNAGQTTAKAIVSATLTNGGMVFAVPADMESSTEADVYANAKANSNWNANSTTAGLRALIDAQTAAAIASSRVAAADVRAEAKAVPAALDARAKMLLDRSIGGTQAELNAFLQAETNAQVQEDQAIDAATSQAQMDAAVQARSDATVDAATNAGFTESQYAQAARAESKTYVSASDAISVQAQNDGNAVAALIEATATTRSDEAAFAALSASAAVRTDVQNAGATLKSSIAASEGMAQNVAMAWAAYAAALRTDLKTTAESIHAGASMSIDTLSTNLASARTMLTATLGSASGNPDVIVQALSSFTGAVEAAIRGDATLSAMTPAQQNAIESVMLSIELNAAAGGP